MKRLGILMLVVVLFAGLGSGLALAASPGDDSSSTAANKVVAQGSCVERLSAGKDSGENLDGAIDDTQTSITVTDGSVFEVGDIIRIEDELLKITDIDDNDLEVTRGEMSSTANAHADGEDIWIAKEVRDLLRVNGKYSNPKDLLIQVTAETALYTKVKGSGNMTEYDVAVAEVIAWVTIDGNVVPVSDARGCNGDGSVVFDNRSLGIKTTGLEETQFIELFIDTRAAHGFNWIATDVGQYDDPENGSGTYDIVVWFEMSVDSAVRGDAEAGVGNRTLVVEPVKMATGSTP